MPTYEYACDACKYRFEEMQPITSKPLKKCPKCSKRRLKRLISGGSGFIFKGSGFYITDYRSDSYKESAKKDAPPAAPAEAPKTSSNADSKPTAKAETKPAQKTETKAPAKSKS